MYKKEDFKPLMNKKFKITFDAENEYEVELIDIKEGARLDDLNIDPFTITFKGGPEEKIFSQRLYEVSSEALGKMALFLIPRLPDKEGIYYDAIFG